MKISTIIPVFNREKLIGETLRTVMEQSHPADEVIVVDDGSTDGTIDVVKSVDAGIRVIRQENQGAGASRNRGLQEASGDFVHFMDSDDLSSLNTYECQMDALATTGADVAYGPWVKTRFEKDKCFTQPVVIQQRPLYALPSVHEWVLRGWVTVFQPCLFRRDLINQLGGYRVDLKPSEDSELLFRIGKSGARFVHTPETLVVYRVHPEGQVSIANSHDRERDWLKFLGVLDEQISGDGLISQKTQHLFDSRKLEAIRKSHRDSSAELRQELLSHISTLQRLTHRLTTPTRRIAGKLRRMAYGDNYMKAFGLGRVDDSHKRLIQDLGYTHSGFYNA